MKKVSLSLIATMMVLSATAQASSLAGIWCQHYDDFIAVLKIESNGDFVTYSQGVQAEEIVLEGRGLISQGASSMSMTLNGIDMKVVDSDISTSLLGKKTLKLTKADGSTMVYEQCKAK